MPRERRNPRQPDPRKRKDSRPAGKPGDRKTREDKPPQRDKFPKRKEDTGTQEKKYRRIKEEDPGEKKGPYKRREKTTDGRPGYKGKRVPEKPRPKKYTGAGKKQGDYIPKGQREEEAVRLNKYIANAGICSRREADELIKAGVIKVNGEIVTELGTKVKPVDKVHYGEQLLSHEKKRYILLNKQKGYVTTTKDPHAKNTVMELIAGACKERVYPVGRLDRNTVGLLLFTNDGELSKKLTHPSSKIKKLYHVVLDQPLKKADMVRIADGIELEDGVMKVDSIAYDITADDKRELGVEIHSGKNRVIRRIFESLGYKVIKLDRVILAGLTKKNLPRGKWRFLTDQEVRNLKKM